MAFNKEPRRSTASFSFRTREIPWRPRECLVEAGRFSLPGKTLPGAWLGESTCWTILSIGIGELIRDEE